MSLSLGAAAILGTAQVASGLLGGSAQRSENKRAWNRNYNMWQQQNEYNSPANQMKLLKEAGLNPMLVYGSGGHSFSASTAPTMTPANMQGVYSDMGNAIGKVAERYLESERVKQAEIKLNQDLQLGQEQINQVRANTNAVTASILKMGAETKRIQAETDSILYNFGLAKNAGVRDSALTPLEIGRSFVGRAKRLVSDVVNGSPDGKNSIRDQVRRFFE